MTTKVVPVIKLSYFPVEGFGECVRLALLLSGTPFEDEHVPYDEWFTTMKPTTPYKQLPVMTIDHGPMRTQSKAMLRWIGATLSTTLYPHEHLLDIEESMGVIEDAMMLWRPKMWPFLYPGGTPDCDKKDYNYYDNTDEGKAEVRVIREKFLKNELPIVLQYFSNLIMKYNHQWIGSYGSNPTIADCLVIPFLRSFTKGTYDYIPPNCLDPYPTIVEYVKRFTSLEPIKGRYTDGLY